MAKRNGNDFERWLRGVLADSLTPLQSELHDFRAEVNTRFNKVESDIAKQAVELERVKDLVRKH